MIIDTNKWIDIESLIAVARNMEQLEISDTTINAIDLSHRNLINILQNKHTIYGINTGFGAFWDKRIYDSEIGKLNRNLILSHAVAVGEPLPEDVVRAAMLVRINTLSKGYSGVRLELINVLKEMLNKGVTPIIPGQGSLGSSGDLCLLSHLGLIATTDDQDMECESGLALYSGAIMSGKEAMNKAGISRLVLGAKEGLALNNGATFSAALGALAVYDSEYLLYIADLACALSMEALCSCSAALDERLHQIRNQTGQIISANKIKDLVTGSTFLDSTEKVQDAYSLRCAPQIHGAIRDSVEYAKQVIHREINAVTDNPLFFDGATSISGGNFHGEPVGLAMDFLAIGLTELGGVSERRTYRMTDEKISMGLPPMLVDPAVQSGLNSGLMLPQYVAASLVLENRTLATPDSIQSLPTSAGQEDHNANSMTAARHAYQIVDNVRRILSIEIYTSIHAINLRLQMQSGNLGIGTKLIFEKLRETVPYKKADCIWGDEIANVYKLIRDRAL